MSSEFHEEFKVSGDELMDRVKHLLHEGNATKIAIRTESGHTVLEIPVTVGAIGVILAPVLAAVGAIAAVLTKCTIVVYRQKDEPEEPKQP